MSTPPPLPPPPPVLKFDEGSRKDPEEYPSLNTRNRPSSSHPRQDVSIEEYYEIERFVGEIASIAATDHVTTTTDDASTMIRIAIQLPDELLADAAELCWAYETALSRDDTRQYFIFVLGDTTYAPCCPDIIASQHLNAQILIHYGHACLSNVQSKENDAVTSAFPIVLYSFGKQLIAIAHCVDDVVQQLHDNSLERNDFLQPQHVLLLYEVQYAHAMTILKDSLQAALTDVTIHMGVAPTQSSEPLERTEVNSSSPTMEVLQHHRILVGGLELPQQFSTNHDDQTNFILLYIGHASSRPFLNIVLRFLSDPKHRPAKIWTWSPTEQTLCTNVFEQSSSFQRILNRRYYLVQKAKQCSTFGIIVAHMTAQIQEFVTSIRGYLESHQLSYYTFVVGKINPTKLANFPEVECFIFLACPEHTLLHNERELYPIPIITPYELLVAFGSSTDDLNTEWGAVPYSTNPNDYWSVSSAAGAISSCVGDGEMNGDDDAPYFSLVTGGYAQKIMAETITSPQLLSDATPDTLVKVQDGTLMTRTSGSTAVSFFQKREYQGLVPMQPPAVSVDGNEAEIDIATAAVLGETGIASNYGNR